MGRLHEEYDIEKEHIVHTLDSLTEALEREDRSVVELAAIATFMQNTYNGIENILKRILKFKQLLVARSESYHKDILNLAYDNNIISDTLSKRLEEYLAFRHFFVHGYGIMLDEDKLIPIAKELPNVWKMFDNEVTSLISSIENSTE